MPQSADSDPGKRTPRHQDRARTIQKAIIAYAGDVTIFLSTPDDIGKPNDILNTYEAATGAMVNMMKSRALALETWDTVLKLMDIPYHTDVKILGFHFTNTVNTSAKETWSMVTKKCAY
jgi:hypothetical protein